MNDGALIDFSHIRLLSYFDNLCLCV